MQPLLRYLRSSIGKKQLMGITGIWLYFYLFIHLLGNVGMVAGPERYNKYGYLLLHQAAEFVLLIEISLIAAFLLHVALALRVRAENRRARPEAYAVAGNHGNKTWYSTTMMITGLVLLAFTFVHISHFRWGVPVGRYMVTYDGVEMRDLHRTMMEAFSVWWFTLAYVAVLLLLASHLAHGVQSSLQTLGFNHPKYRPLVHWFSRGYAVLICGGFSVLALWAFFQPGGA